MPDRTIRHITEFLYRKRRELGLTQEEVADRLHISLTSYRKIEAGKTRLVSPRIDDLARIFGTDPQKILFGYTLADSEDKLLKEEYGNAAQKLAAENERLREKVRMLEEILLSKDEIIKMLKER